MKAVGGGTAGGGSAGAHSFVRTPSFGPLRLDPSPQTTPSSGPRAYFILLHFKTRLGQPSSGRWEEGKEGEYP